MRKLKPIPENTVVHTPTEAEAKELLEILHENGWKWRNNSKYSLLENNYWYTSDMCYIIKPQTYTVGWNTRFSLTVHSLEKPSFLTLAEFKERFVSPYAEPTEENSNLLNNNNMQKDVKFNANKELNLVELLKGHEGEYFYSPFYGEVKLEEIRTPTVESPKYYLLVRPKSYSIGREVILPNGINHEGGQVSLFPSRALYEQYPLDPYTAWMKWAEEQKKYKTYIQIYTVGSDYLPEVAIEDKYYFRTPSDRDKAVEEIKSIIAKYSNGK